MIRLILIWEPYRGEKDGLYNLEQKNKFSVGEEIEVIRPNGDTTASYCK